MNEISKLQNYYSFKGDFLTSLEGFSFFFTFSSFATEASGVISAPSSFGISVSIFSPSTSSTPSFFGDPMKANE